MDANNVTAVNYN